MKEITLLRSSNPEGREAKKYLEDNNIEYIEILKDDAEYTPTLFVEDELYAYRGIRKIKTYKP